MIIVKAIHIAPIKSMGLEHPQTVYVGPAGILEDRRYHLINAQNKLLTQRDIGVMAQLKPEFHVDPEWLCLSFPDGTTLEGPIELGEAVVSQLWDRWVSSRIVSGDWGKTLSNFCGEPVRLARSDEPYQCYDKYPISLMSQASLEEIDRRANGPTTVDSRRFRPNILLSGCGSHEEDSWIDSVVDIGRDFRLKIVARDPRCAITTLNPDTGDRDVDTLRLILKYRPNPKAAYFGVYGIVDRPGSISVGDVVTT